MKWEIVVMNQISYKGLSSRLYQEFIHLKCKLIDQTHNQLRSKQEPWVFFQRRYRNEQQVYEKVANTTNRQGNANRSHNQISPHPC